MYNKLRPSTIHIRTRLSSTNILQLYKQANEPQQGPELKIIALRKWGNWAEESGGNQATWFPDTGYVIFRQLRACDLPHSVVCLAGPGLERVGKSSNLIGWCRSRGISSAESMRFAPLFTPTHWARGLTVATASGGNQATWLADAGYVIFRHLESMWVALLCIMYQLQYSSFLGPVQIEWGKSSNLIGWYRSRDISSPREHVSCPTL